MNTEVKVVDMTLLNNDEVRLIYQAINSDDFVLCVVCDGQKLGKEFFMSTRSIPRIGDTDFELGGRNWTVVESYPKKIKFKLGEDEIIYEGCQIVTLH